MEETASGTSRGPLPEYQFTDFIDLVFSWSPRDIFDDNLFKDQVEEIPESFASVEQYLGSYIYPLLEETRAELASAMETIYKAPFAEITSLMKLKTLFYDVTVDDWKNRQSDRGREPYRTLPGDIVLVSNMKPETASDFERAGWTYTFACVRNIPDDVDGDGCTSCNFIIRTAEPVQDGDEQRQSTLYVVFLMNVMTHKRIWNALRMRRNLRIIEKVLSKDDLGEGNCELCPFIYNTKIEENFKSMLSSNLNESQVEAILASLSKIECYHKSSLDLIWGPPGTGKTTTVSNLLYILLRMNVRTLVCAPTNVAITELASRVLALVRNSGKTESENSFLSCNLGNMLIFGNKVRLKVGSEIEEIFLDFRVDMLAHCLVSVTGWKHCVASMLDFLQDCVSQYQIFMDNELIKAKQSLQDEAQHSTSKSLLEFARDRFSHLATPLRSCMLTFLTHLPRSSIHEQKFKNMEQIMLHLDYIEVLLFEDNNMTSNELESVFLQNGMSVSESSVDTSSFMYVRSQCLCSLKFLHAALGGLDLPIRNASITEFCFQKASLIFCTTSSSFKLHSIDIEPFSLLVIDEAAQVKESESIISLQIPDVRHAILVGDEWQLPATVNSKLSEGAGFGRSLFERLSSLGHYKHLLNVQYRMHPSISQFPNSNFYRNQILDAPCVQSQSYERRYLHGSMFGPYSFLSIRGGKEELDDIGHSRRNMVEVAVILKLVQKLFKAWNGSTENLSIGLISPYAAQVAVLRDKLHQKYEDHEGFIVKVKSVDGFQGGEEDIIIISTVRTDKGGSIGFLASPQRTNVALTRARHCLWILGNDRTLSRSDSVWEAIVCDAKRRKCFFTADEDHDLRKTIIIVKRELEQLDDLLSGESMLFRNSRWKVLFSENFRKSFQKLQPSNVKKLVINILLKLASGWRPKKVNVDCTCESSPYIVKQFKVEKHYVVCSVDIIKDSIYLQVLKVWDVLPMVETPRLLKRLDGIFAMYTDEFINHCNTKLFEGNLEVPKSWSVSNDITRFKNVNTTNLSTSESAGTVDCRSYVENSKVNESLLLMKFYSLSSGTVNHLLTDLEGGEVDLPFEVTDEEREIIMFPRSSFILGRSGTGKTTILTMKLVQKFQHYCIASRESMATDNSIEMSNGDDFSQYVGESSVTTLRQLFVTVSPKLCYAVKKHVSQLKSFATGNYLGNKFTDMDDIDELTEFRDIPDSFVGIQPAKYPLIITFHKFLMMLDGTLGNSYFERFRDVRGFSQYVSRRSVALQTFVRQNEVTYDRFRCLYWPHFNDKLTKNLDPSRAFTEIMSHIKGGLQEGEECDGKRSKKDYIALSDCRVSTLSAEKREAIYDMFEDYEKMKLERGEFDLADFVIDIHLRLKTEDLLGEKMDFVYIDEVQDLTMRQISLFRYICKNVDEGFVFSGDTAQTIARGIDFRFEDIRSLFYNEFFMKSVNREVRGKGEKGLLSDIFCLSQNFRTHTGVLRLAQSVIDVICHFFPQSIDVLPPETSLIYGESPVVLEPGSDENLIMTIFGHSGNAGGKWVGFGADQVILVRDDSARKELSNYIGHQALVLTIVECKGLEFQDVLLYNFFGSSPLSHQWRVVYEFLKEKDLLDANSPSFPTFSESKHNILCSELKQLYVAITRTRQRLWICENNEELSRPMLDYWRRLCLVQVRKIDDSLAEAMQRASSPEEWKSQGIKLFWEKNYEMATLCFERAGDEIWEKRAKASGLRAAADTLRGSNPDEALIMLREAAEIFDSIGRVDSAAECFCDLGEYERAGNTYLKCGMSELRKAGECFSLAGSYSIAAEVYAKGNFFNECLSACTNGNYFDLGLRYIEQWKQHASQSSSAMTKFKDVDKIAQEFLEKVASECYRTKDNASLMKFVRAFNTIESKRNFLKSLDCLEELLILEEESGNFKEGADIAKRLGDILCEVDLLEKAGDFENASLLMLSYVLCNSLWVSGSHGWPLKSFPQKEKLLTKAVSVANNVSRVFHSSVCAEANVMTNEQKNVSELMQCYRASKQSKTLMGEILSARKLLDAHVHAHPAKYEWDLELLADSRIFDENILKNQVSCGTLVYVWNLWKANILGILDCLGSVDGLDLDSCEVQFCFDYFGVRLTHDFTYLLLKSDAAWVGNVVDKRFIVRNRNVATLDARHFASAAQKYWRQEIISVGLRVLEALQALHKHCLMKSLSNYCKSLCLTYIYDVTRFFFLESNSFELMKLDSRKLQDFLQLSMKYFELVFPLDSRQSLSENLIALRETEVSNNLLEEIISSNISTGYVLTDGQIVRVVMIMLGSSKQKCEIYKKIAERLNWNSPWKPVIENLHGIMESVDLICEFHRALEESFYGRWRTKDCITPQCFVYLVERLLILIPHSRGYFFSTKSSFVEHLISLQSDAKPSVGFAVDKMFNPRNIIQSLVRVVQECLYNARETAGWNNKTCRTGYKYYLPVLMQRLFMILCLLCLNSDFSFNTLFGMLNVPQIRSQLPREFCEALLRRGTSHATVFSGAFKTIGYPLVIVSSSGARPKFVCSDATFLDLKSFSCKNEIMKILFMTNTEVGSSSMRPPPVVSNRAESKLFESTVENSGSETGNLDVKINWGLIREMSEGFEALVKRNDGKLKSLVQEKKMELEEHMKFLTAAVARLSEQHMSHSCAEDNIELRETISAIEELNKICSSFNTSNFDSKAMSEIGDALKSLEARRPQVDVLSNDPNESHHAVVSGKMDDEELPESTEDRKRVDDSYSAATGNILDNKGKGKSKNNSKSKKGKKGGRRK